MDPNITEPPAQDGDIGQVIELDFFETLSRFFGAFGADTDAAGIITFFDTIWSIYSVIAFLLSALFVYGFVYASIRMNELQKILIDQYEQQERMYQRSQKGNVKNQRWQDVLNHLESENPNDWKLAIIEADVLLDDAIKEKGYAGKTLGERLKSISSAHMHTLDDAWDAHRIRNRVAHEGADFILTQKLARNTITQYQRVFEELGIV